MKQDERFGHAAGMLGERVRQVLERIPPGIGGTVSEIRPTAGIDCISTPSVCGRAGRGVFTASGGWLSNTQAGSSGLLG